MSNEIRWGTGFAQNRLVCDRPEVLACAVQVLAPWLDKASGKELGVWKIGRDAAGWLLQSPPQIVSYLETLDDGYLPRFESVAQVVKAVEFQGAAAAVLDAETPLGFHAALLARGAKGLAVSGNKEAGKSTLSVALWRQAGYQMFADDGFFIDPLSGHCLPVPRRSRLRKPSRDLFAPEVWDDLSRRACSYCDQDGSLLFHPRPAQPSVQLKAIIVLSAHPGDLEPMEEADALLELVLHTHCYYREGLRNTLHRLAPLCNGIPCYRLGRGSLESRVALVESLPL